MGNIDLLKCLLKLGANPNIQNDDGNTPLHGAAYEGWFNNVKLLLKYKADMYIKDGEGRTPFNVSLLNDNYDTAELFISAGYVPSEDDMQKIKNHRLFKAIKENDLPAVKEAIASGADTTANNEWGKTPFSSTLDYEHYDIAELFVLNGHVPSECEFNLIENKTTRESLKKRLINLVAQVQKHKERLTEEVKTVSQEFAYADEVIEM